MKKILSMLLIFGMFIQMTVNVYAFTDVEGVAVDVVCGLGLMEDKDGSFMPEEELTRGEFAKIIANIYMESADADAIWTEKYFKSIEEETNKITSLPDTNTKFSDVYTNDTIYEAIKIVYEKGLMTGMSENFFGVDRTMTKEQAVKVLVTLLGYQMQAIEKGGYPAGYLSVASELDLLKGMGDFSENITRKETAKLIYNALDIEVLQLVIKGDEITYQTIADETFLRKILGVSEIEGRVEDNGYSSLNGKTNSSYNYVYVDGIRFKVTDDTEYIRDYLGRNVTVYYPEDENEEGFIYARVSDKDKTITFSVRDFVKYSDDCITYMNDEQEKRIKIKPNAYMIYNGSGVGTFSEGDFKFNKGDITLITEKGESDVGVIVINSYNDFVVSYVDEENECIYSEKSLVNDERLLDLSTEEQKKNILIYDENSEKIQLGALSKGNVLSVLKSEYSIKLFRSDKTADNVIVKGIRDDYDKTVIVTDNGEYTLSKDYEELNPEILPVIGGEYSFLLDIFGEIVGIESAVDVGNIGIIAKVYQVEDETAAMKYYTKAKSIENKKLAEKVKITDANGETKKYEVNSQFVKISDLLAIDTLFRYELNSNDEIAEIELPGKQGREADENNRLVEIAIDSTDDYTADGYYYKLNQGFAGSVLVNNDTVIFGINSAQEDYNLKYSIYTLSEFLNDRRYNIKGYTTQEGSAMAEYIIYDSKNAADFSYNDKEIAIVTGIKNGLDSEDVPVTIIECVVSEGSSTNSAIEKELILKDSSVIDEVKNLQGETADTEGNKFKIEVGDIIKYTSDSAGKIEQLYLLFDENAENPVSGGRGIMPGTTGYWVSSDYTHSNPFAITSAGVFSNKAIAWSCSGSAEMKIERANPISVQATALKYTTQDLNVFTYDRENNNYRTYNYVVSQNVIFVSKQGKNITVETSGISDIKTYEEVGKDCDRIFIMSRIGSPNKIVVYRDYIN